jgi:hypothetical protein
MALGSVVAVLAMVGCFGNSDGPTGTVSGKVSFKHQPVSEGRVAFVSVQGKGATGVIGEQGEYSLRTVAGSRIPVGEYQVAIQPPPAEPRDPSSASAGAYQPTPGKIMIGAPGDPVVKDYPNIPLRYRNPATSGWKVTIGEGENQFDFQMTP